MVEEIKEKIIEEERGKNIEIIKELSPFFLKAIEKWEKIKEDIFSHKDELIPSDYRFSDNVREGFYSKYFDRWLEIEGKYRIGSWVIESTEGGVIKRGLGKQADLMLKFDYDYMDWISMYYSEGDASAKEFAFKRQYNREEDDGTVISITYFALLDKKTGKIKREHWDIDDGEEWEEDDEDYYYED